MPPRRDHAVLATVARRRRPRCCRCRRTGRSGARVELGDGHRGAAGAAQGRRAPGRAPRRRAPRPGRLEERAHRGRGPRRGQRSVARAVAHHQAESAAVRTGRRTRRRTPPRRHRPGDARRAPAGQTGACGRRRSRSNRATSDRAPLRRGGDLHASAPAARSRRARCPACPPWSCRRAGRRRGRRCRARCRRRRPRPRRRPRRAPPGPAAPRHRRGGWTFVASSVTARPISATRARRRPSCAASAPAGGARARPRSVRPAGARRRPRTDGGPLSAST